MVKRIRDWVRPIIQVLILVIAVLVPHLINIAGIIKGIFGNNPLDFDNVKYYYAMKMGNGVIGIILMLFLLIKCIRKSNENYCLNKGNYYHEHLYLGYLFCAKILGYKECNIVRMPIYMQFKLLINDTFNKYSVGTEDDYNTVEDDSIEIRGVSDSYTSSVNLVLADTYPISRGMLPASTSNLSTIWIVRNDSKRMVRTYSKKFCNTVREIVSGLPNNVETIHLFSTLNPKHSLWIANNVFKLAGRCQVKALKVFPQSYKNGNWNFAEKGIIIYDER
ncbi:MAG: hypothetical protein MJ123_08960 [Lachnospiraceae bacterium]|nr:hypothetical protein [Lachnospiraceae bacterium]